MIWSFIKLIPLNETNVKTPMIDVHQRQYIHNYMYTFIFFVNYQKMSNKNNFWITKSVQKVLVLVGVSKWNMQNTLSQIEIGLVHSQFLKFVRIFYLDTRTNCILI